MEREWIEKNGIGAFLPRSEASRNQARAWLEGFSEHIQIGGLGHISESPDAEAPHKLRGSIAQTWSVMELLRTALEDVFEMRPAHARTAPHAV